MAEKVTAHLGLHLHTHDVAVVVDVVVHSGAEEIDRKKHCGHYEDFLYHSVWDVDVKDLGCHHRVQKSHHRKNKGAKHIKGKSLFVGLVVRNKFFEQTLVFLV